MEQHVFVDESKTGDYLLVAATVSTDQLNAARRHLQSLYLPRQKYIHMVKERPGRQRSILLALRSIPATVVVYRAARSAWRTDRASRERCIQNLVSDLAPDEPTRILLDRDTGIEQDDRRWLRDGVHRRGISSLVRYEHGKAAQDPLLALPDIVGWALSKGGPWRTSCGDLVDRMTDV